MIFFILSTFLNTFCFYTFSFEKAACLSSSSSTSYSQWLYTMTVPKKNGKGEGVKRERERGEGEKVKEEREKKSMDRETDGKSWWKEHTIVFRLFQLSRENEERISWLSSSLLALLRPEENTARWLKWTFSPNSPYLIFYFHTLFFACYNDILLL